MAYDAFISHASEDKVDVARPLAVLLMKAGLRVWLDEGELLLGDSLRRKIDAGLASSSFGVVVLSKAFFAKEWPQKELDALVAKEISGKKVILPVWHNISAREIASYSPMLADRLGIVSAGGLPAVAAAIVRAISPDRAKAPKVSPAKTPQSIDELIVRLVDRATEASELQADVSGLRTGYYDIDAFVGGLHPGDLHVIASRPSMGRTTFVLNIAEHVATTEGLPVLFFAPTDRAEDLTNRLLSSVGRIDRRRLATGQLADEEWARLVEAVGRVKGAPLYIDDTPRIEIDALIDKVLQVHEKAGALGLIVIDSGVNLFSPSEPDQGARAMERLRQVAREKNCPMLLVMQVPRSVEMRNDKRPTLNDLPLADAIEDSAGFVLFLYRDEYYNRDSRDTGVLEVIVARSRASPSGTVRMVFMGAISRIDNLAEWSKP